MEEKVLKRLVLFSFFFFISWEKKCASTLYSPNYFGICSHHLIWHPIFRANYSFHFVTHSSLVCLVRPRNKQTTSAHVSECPAAATSSRRETAGWCTSYPSRTLITGDVTFESNPRRSENRNHMLLWSWSHKGCWQGGSQWPLHTVHFLCTHPSGILTWPKNIVINFLFRIYKINIKYQVQMFSRCMNCLTFMNKTFLLSTQASLLSGCQDQVLSGSHPLCWGHRAGAPASSVRDKRQD